MCGINGIWFINEVSDVEGRIANMNESLAHRGPDDFGVFKEEHIALGHKRLSIIDLSSSGQQPMHSNDGRYTITYNGELYNYLEIREQLSEYSFQTETDTEVVLAAYSKWGKDCLSDFNGMFAFAIWDNQKEELFISRDRMGIKPLYYHKADNFFVFSSEIRSILASELVDGKLSEEGLVDYLRYQTVHAPHTILENIYALLPGHSITISGNSFKIDKYWDLTGQFDREPESKPYDEICGDINNLLSDAVERRLMSNVPYGAFLSGGIDSSIIVGLMSKVSSERVKTFSVVFDDEEYSEAKYSRLISKMFNTEHNEINLKISDFVEELPTALKAMDHPSGDGLNTYLVSKVTRAAGITVALSGLGGDELFAGYSTINKSINVESNKWLNHVPLSIRKLAGNMLKAARPGVSSNKIAELLMQTDFSFITTYPVFRQMLLDPQIERILNADISSNAVEAIIKGQIFKNSSYNKTHMLSRVSLAEITTYMQNVLLSDTDQMSMASALEVRVPFLDHKLVEYVINVPDVYKTPVTPKKLLVDAVDGLIPPDITNRTKMGFVFPWNDWLKNELKEFCEQKLQSLSSREQFNEQGIDNLWQRFLRKDPEITWARIWILVVLENWLLENDIT